MRLARRIAQTTRERYRERCTWLRLRGSVEGTIAWGARLVVHPDSAFALGHNSSIGHGTIVAVKPGRHGNGSLAVGRGTFIGEYNNLRSEGAEIRIGDHCLISQFVSLIASGHGYRLRDQRIVDQPVPDAVGVAIDDDVWIGANAVVLPAVHIGQGAVVAAGSVVTRDVAPYTIVAGSPARPVGERS